jgi:hypothetical protein
MVGEIGTAAILHGAAESHFRSEQFLNTVRDIHVYSQNNDARIVSGKPCKLEKRAILQARMHRRRRIGFSRIISTREELVGRRSRSIRGARRITG